jgi:hypothetical protein
LLQNHQVASHEDFSTETSSNRGMVERKRSYKVIAGKKHLEAQLQNGQVLGLLSTDVRVNKLHLA